MPVRFIVLLWEGGLGGDRDVQRDSTVKYNGFKV